MKVGTSRVVGLGVAVEVWIFVSVSDKSVGIFFLLLVWAKGFYGLGDHRFDGGFRQSCVDYRVGRGDGSG